MAACCNSDLFREATEVLCYGWKSPEIQNLQNKLPLSIQDEVAKSNSRSNSKNILIDFYLIILSINFNERQSF